MKYVKSHYESALTDGHVQLILMTGNTNFEPQLSEMSLPSKNSVLIYKLVTKIVLSYYILNFPIKNVFSHLLYIF